MSKILIDEATVKLVLYALEDSVDLVEEDYANAVSLYGKYPSKAQRLIGMETMRDDHIKAITALKEMAEQPAQQEPVLQDNSNYRLDPPGLDPLYTTPQPAQRTWVGLTEEEKTELRREHYSLPLLLIKATEAKLRSKNEDRN